MTAYAEPSTTPVHFEIARVRAMRKAASCAVQLADEGADGWSFSPMRPAAIVEAMPALTLLPGLELQGYEYRRGPNGNGVVWAVPAGTAPAAIPEPLLNERNMYPFEPVPRPAGAQHAMSAVAGDGTAWSYMCASIAVRELAEFGARWHGCSWADEKILGAAPWEEPPDPDRLGPGAGRREDWNVITALPGDWSPYVQIEDGQVTVRMHTYSGVLPETIIKNTDRYTPGTYRPAPEFEELAYGPGGFVY